MPGKIWKLNKLFGAVETTFNVDPSADGSGYQFLFASEVTFQPQVEVIDRIGDTGTFARQQHVIGGRGGTLSFKMELKGSGVDNTTVIGNQSALSEAAPILGALMTEVRQVSRNTGAARPGGADPTQIFFEDNDAVELGTLLYVAGNIYMVIGHSAIGTDVANDLDKALDVAGQGLGIPVGVSTVYKRKDTGHPSMTYHANRDGVAYTFRGCKQVARLEGVNARGIPMLTVEVEVGNWTSGVKPNLPVPSASPFMAVKPPVVKGAPLYVGGVSRLATGIDFDPGMTFSFMETTEDANNKSGIVLTDAVASGTFRPYYDPSHMSTFEAGTVTSIAFYCGELPRFNGFGLLISAAQFQQPSLEDRNGIVGESVPFSVTDAGTRADYVIALM